MSKNNEKSKTSIYADLCTEITRLKVENVQITNENEQLRDEQKSMLARIDIAKERVTHMREILILHDVNPDTGKHFLNDEERATFHDECMKKEMAGEEYEEWMENTPAKPCGTCKFWAKKNGETMDNNGYCTIENIGDDRRSSDHTACEKYDEGTYY